jgi:hypothetical protein
VLPAISIIRANPRILIDFISYNLKFWGKDTKNNLWTYFFSQKFVTLHTNFNVESPHAKSLGTHTSLQLQLSAFGGTTAAFVASQR